MAIDNRTLSEKRCAPCHGGIPPFTPEEARAHSVATPEWTLEDGATRLRRRFEFEDFRGAMAFVNRVADLAEGEGHHPDIAIHWNKVDLVLWTHKIGGLHENDFILAAKIDRLLQEPSVGEVG